MTRICLLLFVGTPRRSRPDESVDRPSVLADTARSTDRSTPRPRPRPRVRLSLARVRETTRSLPSPTSVSSSPPASSSANSPPLPRSLRSPTLVARTPLRKSSPPKVSMRVFSSVAPARRLASSPRRVSTRRRQSSPIPAVTRPQRPSCRRFKMDDKKNPRVSVGHDSSTRTQSSSRTRHRRLRARWRKNSPIIHPSVRRRRDASRRASSSSRARRDASRDATRRVGPDGGSAARGGARRRRRRRSGPSGRVAVHARARARDRAVARASLEEWPPSPMPHARRLATASVP